MVIKLFRQDDVMVNHEHEDIIMFPGWRKQLENESLNAVKHKNFKEALIHIEKLESFQEATNEILTAKVICLIELNRYDEALELCKKLMYNDQSQYYKYLHIYLSILFQTSRYEEVISLLDEIFETEKVPFEFEQSYLQIYNMSKQFLETSPDQQMDDQIEQFIESLEKNELQTQWGLLSVLRQQPIQPYLKRLTPYLADTNLNPIIKTGILQWCTEYDVNKHIEVEKFGQDQLFNPNELEDVFETKFAIAILYELDDIEQSDPTLFIFIKQILYRLLYIYYPFTPNDEELKEIAKAASYLATKYLYDDEKKMDQYIAPNVLNWVEKIEQLEKKYFSQIEV